MGSRSGPGSAAIPWSESETACFSYSWDALTSCWQHPGRTETNPLGKGPKRLYIRAIVNYDKYSQPKEFEKRNMDRTKRRLKIVDVNYYTTTLYTTTQSVCHGFERLNKAKSELATTAAALSGAPRHLAFKHSNTLNNIVSNSRSRRCSRQFGYGQGSPEVMTLDLPWMWRCSGSDSVASVTQVTEQKKIVFSLKKSWKLPYCISLLFFL